MTVCAVERVERSFSRSFGSYHNAARQQAWIADRLVQELAKNGAPRRFRSGLELGCGTGLLTEGLRRNFDIAEFCINDLSPEARQTAEAAGAAFLCGDAMRVGWPDQTDLIASASMIQWLPDPASFLKKAADALAPGGWLAVSGFGPEQYRELVQIGSAAAAPGLCRPEDLVDVLDDNMEVMAQGEELRRSDFASPGHALRHLRKTGVNGRARQVWTKSNLIEFTAEYRRRFETDAGVPLTYHPVWVIARKRG